MVVIGRVYHGRVQGVGFRVTARHVAHSLGVDGWVRNEPDGSVRLVASGGDDAIDRFEAGIGRHLGGGITTIEAFEPSHEETPGTGEGFEVRR